MIVVAHNGSMTGPPPAWAAELALLTKEDAHLPSGLDGINLVLNRARLAAFLAEFAEDKDLRDLLALDLIAHSSGLPLSSSGLPESSPALASRPFRLWEYVWLYKSLRLSSGGLHVLDLGGPSTHLSILAALAGCRVTSVDINPEFVSAARECARVLRLDAFEARHGDMRDLSEFAPGSFDVVVSCSVLEHLAGQDQQRALAEAARVLKTGGVAGLTFDYGPPAPGVNEYLPPPHNPPTAAAEALRRFARGGLTVLGTAFVEDPIPDSLFHSESVHYTVASLFLGKPPAAQPAVPRPETTGTALDRLQIERLPHRIYGTLKSSLAQHGNLSEIQRIAAERATELESKHQALIQMHAEAERRAEAIHEREERIELLERIAAERGADLESKDLALTALREEAERRAVELERAVAAIHEREERIALLETHAAERLTAMLEKEQVIAQLDAELKNRPASPYTASQSSPPAR